jgi:hypothetical protein
MRSVILLTVQAARSTVTGLIRLIVRLCEMEAHGHFAA